MTQNRSAVPTAALRHKTEGLLAERDRYLSNRRKQESNSEISRSAAEQEPDRVLHNLPARGDGGDTNSYPDTQGDDRKLGAALFRLYWGFSSPCTFCLLLSCTNAFCIAA